MMFYLLLLAATFVDGGLIEKQEGQCYVHDWDRCLVTANETRPIFSNETDISMVDFPELEQQYFYHVGNFCLSTEDLHAMIADQTIKSPFDSLPAFTHYVKSYEFALTYFFLKEVREQYGLAPQEPDFKKELEDEVEGSGESDDQDPEVLLFVENVKRNAAEVNSDRSSRPLTSDDVKTTAKFFENRLPQVPQFFKLLVQKAKQSNDASRFKHYHHMKKSLENSISKMLSTSLSAKIFCEQAFPILSSIAGIFKPKHLFS